MKKSITSIAVATILLLYLSSCKKDHAALIERKFSAEALAYVQLPLNKYFIYKDSATGVLDSVFVTQNNLETVFVPKSECSGFCSRNPAYYYQTFTLKLTKFSTTGSENWYNGTASLLPSLFDYVAIDNGSLELPGIFVYPSPNYTGSLTTSMILPTLNIEGKTYLNVLQYSYTSSMDITSSSYLKINCYWAKGIGIIKREIRTSTTVKTEVLVRNG